MYVQSNKNKNDKKEIDWSVSIRLLLLKLVGLVCLLLVKLIWFVRSPFLSFISVVKLFVKVFVLFIIII